MGDDPNNAFHELFWTSLAVPADRSGEFDLDPGYFSAQGHHNGIFRGNSRKFEETVQPAGFSDHDHPDPVTHRCFVFDL